MIALGALVYDQVQLQQNTPFTHIHSFLIARVTFLLVLAAGAGSGAGAEQQIGK